jgi:hypothetical protein
VTVRAAIGRVAGRAGVGDAALTAAPRRHWEMLALAAGITSLAALLQVQPDGLRVGFHLGGWGGELPPTCPLHAIGGIPCPGCGLTRSFVHLAHGDFAAAWEANRMGPAMAGAVLAQFPYRLAVLATRPAWRMPRRWANVIAAALIGGLVANWGLAVTVWPQVDERPPAAAAPEAARTAAICPE